MNQTEAILGLIGGIESEIQEELNSAYMKHGKITAQKSSDVDYTLKYEVQEKCHILEGKIDTINKITSVIEEAFPQTIMKTAV